MKSKPNSKMVKALKALVAVTIAVSAFYIGTYVGEDAEEPKTLLVTETKIKYQTVEKPVIQYVDKREVTFIDRVERVPVELRNFGNLEELKRWLVRASTNITTIYFEQPDVTIDCDDFALALQRKALEDGYMMSFQIIESSKYNSLFKSSKMPPDTLHAINLAIVGNNAYYIEPQTGEVAFVVHLD